jgi:uncharacterized membrane protein YbhN (UPF0104 family)
VSAREGRAAGSATPLGVERERRLARLAWASGALLLLALVLVVGHLGEERQLAAHLREARPGWLAVAAALQLATYLCAAGVWQRALRRVREAPAFRSLVPLGLAKLFTDQAVPSAGMSGNLLLVKALGRRGVPRADAVATMLVGLTGFYLAYALAVTAAVATLWVLGELNHLLLVLATAAAVLAGVVPALLISLGERLARRLPAGAMRLPGARAVVAVLSELPPGGLWRPRLAAESVGLQLGVVLLDAATLGAMLVAVGHAAPPAIVFVSFVFASVVATLAWVPGGIGTFEGTCVAMLHSHGVSLEAALAATLLLRGFTFWLPMLPGLWLARRELEPPRGRRAAS